MNVGLALGLGSRSVVGILPPALLLDFASGSLDPRVTFVRASSGTRFNSSGAMVLEATNAPRFDHNPVTLAPRGLLIERQRTNLLLNSLLDGTSLATQSPTVTAVAHTLSFYGTGSVALSGAFTGSLAGTGANNRVSLTFTPTAGALTLTVTGQVRWANLETGSFATSFIPTAGAAATRSGEFPVITGTDFSSWFASAQGTFVFEGETFNTVSGQFPGLFSADDGTVNNRIAGFFSPASGLISSQTAIGGAFVNASSGNTTAPNTVFKAAHAYQSGQIAVSLNGGAVVQSANTGLPSGINRLRIGLVDVILDGRMRSIRYWPTRLTDAQLQTITA